MYKIEFSVTAAKTYLKLPKNIQQQIDTKLHLLAQNPYEKNHAIKHLHGLKGCYRLRVGDWRIIYEVVNQKLKIYIIKIGLRKEVYRT
jgi:mRNA interferase RelE/StbE